MTTCSTSVAHNCFCMCLSLAAIANAHAQSTKPGLWEHSTTLKTASGQMESQMAEMQKQVAALPADQRKMMEQMLAQQGVSVSMGGGGRTTVKYCVTPEEAAKAHIPTHDENCRYTVTSRSANAMAMTFACSDEGKTRGEGSVTFQGDTAYKGQFIVNTVVDGKPERMEMQQSGKWLSSQCGKVGHLPTGR